MGLVRFKSAVDYVVGYVKAFGDNSGYIPAVTLVDSTGAASVGAKAASASLSVTPAGLEYETVAAGSTAQALGATGATGDYLSHVILQPAATNAGTTTILDNATVIFTYTSGTLSDLRPIIVPLNLFSVSGAWKITTGASMAAIGVGDFT